MSALTVDKAESSQKVEIGLKNLLKDCPRASSGVPCEKCTIEADTQNKKAILHCHCGRQITLPGGRTQNAKTHWATGTCGIFNSY